MAWTIPVGRTKTNAIATATIRTKNIKFNSFYAHWILTYEKDNTTALIDQNDKQ